jgi:hypothetical protein
MIIKYSTRQKIRVILLISAIILVIIQLIISDYKNISLANIARGHLNVISLILLIISLILSYKFDNKQKHKIE